MTRRTAIRTCPLCEATCGLAIEIEDDRVVGVRGDTDDVFSRGYLCPKGATIGELEHDPDRLTAPRVRRDGTLEPATWDEAFSEVADRLRPIVDEHGPDSVAIYVGNPNAHTLSGQLYLRALIKSLRTRNVYSASSVDQLPKHVSAGLTFGDPLAIPVPDIDRTDLLVVLGGDPRTSNGSLWTAPDLPGRLDALRARGGRLVVVDPRRSRTAKKADQHLAIRPGTDALLLAAIVATLVEEDLVDVPDGLAAHIEGIDAACDALRGFSAERVAATCGVEAEAIRGLARDLATADRAVVYGRLGTTTVEHGTVASWLVDVVNVLTGNLDRPGGAMFPKPSHHRPGSRRPFRMGRWSSRVRDLPEAIGELPVATLVDEIETPGDGQVRALVVVGGNPALSTPDAARLDAAIAGLELVVAVDPYVGATARHADVVLPPPGALQRSHCDLVFAGLSIRNVINYSPAALPLPDDQLDEWEILLALASIALGAGVPRDDAGEVDVAAADAFVAQQTAEALVADPHARIGIERDPAALLAAVGDRHGPERMLDLVLRAGPYGDGFTGGDGLTLATLEAAPHGIDHGPLESRIPDVLTTEDGRVHLSPEPFLAQLPALAAVLDADPAPVVLIGRRHLRTNNSWSHNVPSLSRGRSLCVLQVHPDDAARDGLIDGARARVTSAAGTVEVDVEVTDDLRPGVVSLPHGFGHDLEGVELQLARSRPGTNTNVLTDRFQVDRVSGTAVLNGIPVELAPA
ncbi:molybdopterin-dependent oxidoreductase [Nitriliruptor alkaliphilus]|uniref:molybdopterin-dependent oxidoreductase n=1 Tax=Nitriliruptor alkaliphilus TaxID=427918 RepID=UPI000698B9A5|nr:molybdopterin-dependent oxidoreductase [Nitriliruptor alkaliphilus]